MVRPVCIEHFDEGAFEQGLKESELHFMMAREGVVPEWKIPRCPYAPGSGQHSSWSAGFYFGLPI